MSPFVLLGHYIVNVANDEAPRRDFDKRLVDDMVLIVKSVKQSLQNLDSHFASIACIFGNAKLPSSIKSFCFGFAYF